MSLPPFPIDDLRRTNPALDQVLSALTAQGHEVRLIGGAVRDHLLGRPMGDVDLATTALPDQTVRLLKQAGVKSVPVGIEFGTVIGVADGTGFEITTLRADVETDGRHAKVIFTTDWQQDAFRRDLTINALSVDLTGQVYDYGGGLDDLAAKRLRLIGTPIDRLHEDYLRLLRVFRFASQLGDDFTIEDDTLTACTQAQSGLKHLSGERVLGELSRLLVGPNALAIAGMMEARSIWQTLFGRSIDLDALAALSVAENQPDPIRRLMAGFGPAATAELLAMLNAPGRERGRAQAVDLLLRPGALDDEKTLLRRIWKDGTQPACDAALLAHRADLLPVIEKLAAQEFPVQGRDLLSRGVAPGPDVGRHLALLEDWWFDHDMPDRAACLHQLDNMLAR